MKKRLYERRLTRFRQALESDADLTSFWTAHRAVMALEDETQRRLARCFGDLLHFNRPMCRSCYLCLIEHLQDSLLNHQLIQMQYQALFVNVGGASFSDSDQRLISAIFDPLRRPYVRPNKTFAEAPPSDLDAPDEAPPTATAAAGEDAYLAMQRAFERR